MDEQSHLGRSLIKGGETTPAALPRSPATNRRRAGWKKWLGRFALLFGSFLLTVIVGEVVLRVISPGYSPLFLDIYRLDDSGILCLRPGIERHHVSAEWDVTVRINEAGLRDRPQPLPDSGGRVLVVGDSMTFGWGVELEQSFPYVAEEALRPRNMRIIKAGLPGTGPGDQLLWLRRYGADHKPDALVVSLFIGNDFADVQMGGVAAQYTVKDGLMVKKSLDPENESLLKKVKESVKSKTMLGQQLAQAIWIWQRSRIRPQERVNPGLNVADRWLWEFFKIHLAQPPPETRESFRLMCETLDEIQAWAHERNANVLLVFIPRSFQIYDWELTKWKESYKLQESQIDRDQPQRLLTEWARRNKVAALDLLPAFEAYAKKYPDDRTFFYPNSHMTAAGHKLAGTLLANELRGLSGSSSTLGEVSDAPQ